MEGRDGLVRGWEELWFGISILDSLGDFNANDNNILELLALLPKTLSRRVSRF